MMSTPRSVSSLSVQRSALRSLLRLCLALAAASAWLVGAEAGADKPGFDVVFPAGEGWQKSVFSEDKANAISRWAARNPTVKQSVMCIVAEDSQAADSFSKPDFVRDWEAGILSSGDKRKLSGELVPLAGKKAYHLAAVSGSTIGNVYFHWFCLPTGKRTYTLLVVSASAEPLGGKDGAQFVASFKLVEK